jgi:hypothetical protein
VTIAAKQDMIDWLEPEIDHLATERPEGYRSWRLLYNRLQSQGDLSTPMQVALATLAALSEHGSEDASAVEKAKREAMLDIHLRSSAPSTSDVARVCSELEQYDCTGIERLSDMIASWASRLPAETLVTELCKNPYPNAASAIVSSCPSIYELITVAVHYDLDDTYQCYMDRNCTRVVEYLRTRDAAEARSVIQRCFPRVELFHLAVHHRLTDVMFDDDYYDVETWIDGIINDLCARDAVSARAILDICDSFYMLVSVAVHHGFTDMIPAMVDRTPDDMVDYLRTREAAEARTVVELCPSRCELIYVAAHHGFSDLIAGYLRRDLAGVERFLSKDVFGLSKFLPKCSAEHWQLVPFVVQYRCKLVSHFITRDADGRIIAPGSSPTSPHRLSDDDAVNAWLWLIKGDGHVTDKAWDAMKATGLLNGEPAIVQMLDGLYASGRKIASAIRFRSVHYDDCRVIFRHAISTSNLDMVKYFMDREMPRCRLEHHWLNHVRDVPTAQYLVKKGAEISPRYNAGDDTPLHHAHNVDMAKYFVKNGIEVNARRRSGETPLHLVENVDVARYLLWMNADVHARDTNERTPLHTVNNAAIVQLLIDHNASVDAVITGSGNTRLHDEVDPAIIRCLIKNGADVCLQNKKGCTPLHCAKDDAVIRSILDAQIDLLQAGPLTDADAETKNSCLQRCILNVRTYAMYNLPFFSKS